MNITSKIKPFEATISQKFHEDTKITRFVKQKSYEKWPEDWKTVYFKGYPRFNALKLPKPSLDSKISFKKIMHKRQSWRNFSKVPLIRSELSTLLYYSAGIRKKNSTWTGNRFYPSAGSRYPLEVYPLIFNAEGIPQGIYHYYIKSHILEVLPKKNNFRSFSLKSFGDQKWVKNASLLLVVSGVFYRNNVKYGERGYRHVLTELGCMIQNIYLICTALDIGCCPTGGFLDNGYNSLLDIDGTEESVIAVIAIGNR